ncbi:MAG TPA: RNB domain-containing ribonuclease [Burkholderiales bacterium]|nr:RNB domain-containing ribonuclease [Burkholderiales bacterium]
MNVFYEEEGSFRIGTILADNDASLQVEAPHGKRTKIKTSSVLFRFNEPLSAFMEGAQKTANDIDLDFLWECCGQEEFSYDTLARDYFGHLPDPRESAAVLLRLHGAPMYFYKKGRGRYRPAPPEALKAALASVERKRQQALLQAQYAEQLRRFELPDAFRPRMAELLYKPDRSTVEVKALEETAAQLRLSTLRLLEKCGAIPSTRDYHFDRFLFEYFPRGIGFADSGEAAPLVELPHADVAAFSIDDSTTTEIDDAFSVTPEPGGGWRIGIHIAAPALGIVRGSPVDQEAATRLSTVYTPGAKITMLPDWAIARYSLTEGRTCPALSLYLEVSSDLAVRGNRTALEQIRMAANLRHAELEAQFNEESVTAALPDFPFMRELKLLWELATVLEAGRGRPEPVRAVHMDYNFYLENGRVRIVERRRGSPVDKLVSELMILVNSEWGRTLAEAGIAGIYRVQSNGKVRMSTVPSGHHGLGVSQYIWASSPIRRYVDLINQRQLLAWHRGEPAPYTAGSEQMLSAIRDFEIASDVYAQFQHTMERYWCLRWLIQEGVLTTPAEVIRENLVKIDRIPLIARVMSLPLLDPGVKVELKISDIDLLELTFHAEYSGAA